MNSEWKVTSNLIGNQKLYGAYRFRDMDQPDHSGNREYLFLGKGYWVEDEAFVQDFVDLVNEWKTERPSESETVLKGGDISRGGNIP